jgi:hypothetical protein
VDYEQFRAYLKAHNWTLGEINQTFEILSNASTYLRFGVASNDIQDEKAITAENLNRVLRALIPEHCKGLTDIFWNSQAGQLILEAQYWLVSDDLLTPKSAAEFLFGNQDSANFKFLQSHGNPIRKPDIEIRRNPFNGIYAFKRSELEEIKTGGKDRIQ